MQKSRTNTILLKRKHNLKTYPKILKRKSRNNVFPVEIVDTIHDDMKDIILRKPPELDTVYSVHT